MHIAPINQGSSRRHSGVVASQVKLGSGTFELRRGGNARGIDPRLDGLVLYRARIVHALDKLNSEIDGLRNNRLQTLAKRLDPFRAIRRPLDQQHGCLAEIGLYELELVHQAEVALYEGCEGIKQLERGYTPAVAEYEGVIGAAFEGLQQRETDAAVTLPGAAPSQITDAISD